MRLLPLIVAFALAGCGADRDGSVVVLDGKADPDAEPAEISTPAPEKVAQPVPELSTQEQARVCRTAIADLNGHSPDIVRVKSNISGQVVVQYNRPDDGKAWTNECKFEGDRIIWRTVGAFGDSQSGRWRDESYDEIINFAVNGPKITITTTFSDGSGSTEIYTVN